LPTISEWDRFRPSVALVEAAGVSRLSRAAWLGSSPGSNRGDGPDADGHTTLHMTPERLWHQRNVSRAGMRPSLVSGPLVPPSL